MDNVHAAITGAKMIEDESISIGIKPFGIGFLIVMKALDRHVPFSLERDRFEPAELPTTVAQIVFFHRAIFRE